MLIPEPTTTPISTSQATRAQHQPDDAALVGAERDADADLGAAAGHRVGRDAVQAEPGEEQREPAEEHRHGGEQPLLDQRRIDLRGRASARQREPRVDRGERRRDAPGERQRRPDAARTRDGDGGRRASHCVSGM